MRRGRPSAREDFRREILAALAGHPYPATASTIKRLLDGQRLRPCGWDTVRKYLTELAGERLVVQQTLPGRAGSKPLVVYQARGRATGSGREFLGTFCED